jgi:DHA3 family macrolide efflux protein-like MFS transporter
MLSGVDDMWLIFLVMAVRSVGAGFQMPAVSALLPQIVPTDQLMRINGINSSIQSSLGLLAPVVAAAVYQYMSLESILFIDVVTAVIGIGMLILVAVPPLERVASADKPSYFADLKDGISYIFSNDLVRWVMAIFAIVFFLIVAPSNLSPLMVVRNFGTEVWMLTVLEIAFGVGMVGGGIFMAVVGSKLDRLNAIVGTSILFGILAVGMGFTTNLWLFYGLFFIVGLVVPAFSTSAFTLLQETVEPERQGRVFGFVGIVMSVSMPLGMAILGPLADVVSVELLLIITGAATVLIATVAVLLPAGKRAISASQANRGMPIKRFIGKVIPKLGVTKTAGLASGSESLMAAGAAMYEALPQSSPNATDPPWPRPIACPKITPSGPTTSGKIAAKAMTPSPVRLSSRTLSPAWTPN